MKSEEYPYVCQSRSVEVSVDTLTGLKSAVECQCVKLLVSFKLPTVPEVTFNEADHRLLHKFCQQNSSLVCWAVCTLLSGSFVVTRYNPNVVEII